MKARSPSKRCPQCSLASSVIRDGSYYRKSDARKIQRYRCKKCHLKFSNASFSAEIHQNKRRVNHTLLLLFASGISQRRAAILLKVHRTTIKRKFEFLALQSRIKNQQFLRRRYKYSLASEVQFDDLITIEHTKLKPVSVSTIVDKKTRVILGTKVSQIGSFGLLAKISRKKYGRRKNNHRQKLNELFSETHCFISKRARLESDEHHLYPKVVQAYFPDGEHIRYKGGRSCIAGQGELKKLRYDPLFVINHTYAMLRANINRLFRRTWNTTKCLSQLQNHLDIYIYAFNTKQISKK